MTHPLDIPDFLRRTPERQAEINASWKGKRLRSVGAGSFDLKPKKVLDPDVKAFLREQEKREKAKRDARFAMLRERAALAKKQAVK